MGVTDARNYTNVSIKECVRDNPDVIQICFLGNALSSIMSGHFKYFFGHLYALLQSDIINSF